MATPTVPRVRKTWFRIFQYDEGRDAPTEARSILLVIATLIATVTFQAGVTPPGGVWQETDEGKGHVAGQAIYASQKVAFYVFLVSNTLALSTSILTIMTLTHKFPFRVEIFCATVFMLVTYGASIFAVTPAEFYEFRVVMLSGLAPFIVRFLLHKINKYYSMLKECASKPQIS